VVGGGGRRKEGATRQLQDDGRMRMRLSRNKRDWWRGRKCRKQDVELRPPDELEAGVSQDGYDKRVRK
jgi:hypothetical protein